MFSDTNTKDARNLVYIITQETDVNDILFDHVPIDTTSNVPLPPDPSLNFSDILLPKSKGKNAVAKKISYKCKIIRQKNDKTKELPKKATDNMKKSKHLQTDDMETVTYNSDIELDNLSTANHNSDVEIDDVSDAETTDYDTKIDKNSVAQQQAERIIKKYRNLKRKATIQNNIAKK